MPMHQYRPIAATLKTARHYSEGVDADRDGMCTHMRKWRALADIYGFTSKQP